MTVMRMLEEEAKKQNKVIKLHLHVDTGMCRFGCRPEEALPLAQYITRSKQLSLEGLMTHLAAADEATEDTFTELQFHKLEEVLKKLDIEGIHPRHVHAANSAGAIRFHK